MPVELEIRPMDNDQNTSVKPKLEKTVRKSNPTIIKIETTKRTTARKAYRARIEFLLDESKDEQLADIWQRVYPLPIDPVCELPDRRGIIEDLADFVEVLQPSPGCMKAHRLFWLLEKYATYESRQSNKRSTRSSQSPGHLVYSRLVREYPSSDVA